MAHPPPPGASLEAAELIDIRPDEQLDTSRLEAYLRAHLPGAVGPLAVRQFGGGHANLTYLLRFGTTEFVLRRPPLGPVAPGAHDMRREHRVLSVLYRGYPLAPRSFLLCEDEAILGAVFFVMERRHGFAIRADLPERFQGDRALNRRIGDMIVDTLADLHLVDYATVGLEGLGRPAGFAKRQLEGWSKRWEAAKDKDDAGMTRLVAWLAERVPDSPRVALLHNDFKLDNMLVDEHDPAQPVAVLDWDMATLGDPLMDLGSFLGYWSEAGDPQDWIDVMPMPTWRDGFPSRRDVIARYAARTGFDVDDVTWYFVFGTFKLAVVLQQIFIRWKRGQTHDARFANFDRRVATLIDKGHIIIGAASD